MSLNEAAVPRISTSPWNFTSPLQAEGQAAALRLGSPAASSSTSPYEEQRRLRIADNQAILASLGLLQFQVPDHQPCRRTRRRGRPSMTLEPTSLAQSRKRRRTSSTGRCVGGTYCPLSGKTIPPAPGWLKREHLASYCQTIHVAIEPLHQSTINNQP